MGDLLGAERRRGFWLKLAGDRIPKRQTAGKLSIPLLAGPTLVAVNKSEEMVNYEGAYALAPASY